MNSPIGLNARTGTGAARFVREPDGTLHSMHDITGTYYYALDGLGSVAGLTAAVGTTTSTNHYEPFGRRWRTTGTAGTANPFTFVSGYDEGAGNLIKFGTRYYDTTTGRWTQQDPIPGTIDTSGRLNRYTYVANDPATSIDATGYFCPFGTYGGDGGACRGGVQLTSWRIAPLDALQGWSLDLRWYLEAQRQEFPELSVVVSPAHFLDPAFEFIFGG